MTSTDRAAGTTSDDGLIDRGRIADIADDPGEPAIHADAADRFDIETTTIAPSWWNRSAIARPIPRAPPVTMTTRRCSLLPVIAP